MNIIALIAEKKIKEALENGEFDHLPGHGKPLVLEDFSAVPEHLRTGFKILKNAGMLPAEVELRKEVAELRDQLAGCRNAEERERLRRRINTADLQYHLLIEQHSRRPQKQ
jgi:DNA-binding transcriptional regulator PaaX